LERQILPRRLCRHGPPRNRVAGRGYFSPDPRSFGLSVAEWRVPLRSRRVALRFGHTCSVRGPVPRPNHSPSDTTAHAPEIRVRFPMTPRLDYTTPVFESA